MPVNETLEYIRIGFAFSGALLGALIGTPLVEWFKDQLGARRQWKTQRHDIVGTLRLTLGVLRAFAELRAEAFGLPGQPVVVSIPAFRRLAEFDLACLDSHSLKLSSLHPDDSARSAVAQRLVQHLFVLKTYLRQLQCLELVPITRMPENEVYFGLSDDDQSTLNASDAKYVALQRFLAGIYAQRLDINPLSLIVDEEVVNHEFAMASHDAAASQQELERHIREYRRATNKPDA